MNQQTFQLFWNMWSTNWLQTQYVEPDHIRVSDLCRIRPDYDKVLYVQYASIKDTVKKIYFQREQGKDIRLNKYKRAAALAYAINRSNPLVYFEHPKNEHRIDLFCLKQRLAFYVAWGSILEEYPKHEVTKVARSLFAFPRRSPSEVAAGADDFITSIYKDMFYAEIYHNYNVLTMANLFWALTEKASALANIPPL